MGLVRTRQGRRPSSSSRASGVVKLEAGQQWFQAAIEAPAEALAGLVEHYWSVRWDVPDGERHVQHTLSNASIHLVFEPNASRLQGIVKGRFTRVLKGQGRVFGVKFRPGGFHPFLNAPASTLTDRVIAISDVFGAEGDRLAERILAEGDEDGRIRAADAFLTARIPPPDSRVALVAGLADRMMEDREIKTVDQIVEMAGIDKRTLQRLFSEYVGVNPKWIIQRYRLHEAIARVEAEPDTDLAALALDLGYSDQAHFARAFKAVVGWSPGRHVR